MDSNIHSEPTAQIGTREWIDATLASTQEASAQPVTSEAPQPVEAQPQITTAETPQAAEPQPVDWKAAVIPEDPDIDKFFWGKPVAELTKSYKSARDEFKAKSDEAAKLRTELATKQALEDVLGRAFPKQPEKPAPSVWEKAGIVEDTDPLVKPREFMLATEQVAREEAKKAAIEALRQEEYERRQQWTLQSLEAAREQIGLSQEDFFDYAIPLHNRVVRKYGPDAVFNADLIVREFTETFRPAAAPQHPAPLAAPPPAVPASPANPPGAKAATQSAPVDRAPNGAPTLSSEEREAAMRAVQVLRHAGEDIDENAFLADFAARKEARLGELRRRR